MNRKMLFHAFAVIIITLNGCSHDKKVEILKKHMETIGFNNFQLDPSLEVYIQLMKAKTKTNINYGFECEFYGEKDSIIDSFTIELFKDSIDINHKDIPINTLLENIAKDIKPLIEKDGRFEAISIVWSDTMNINGNVGLAKDIAYKSYITEIPNKSNSIYKLKGDTISFKDYYYNNIIAYRGQILGGKRVGYWEYWYSNGKKRKEGEFKDGEKVGEWKYWNENGDELK